VRPLLQSVSRRHPCLAHLASLSAPRANFQHWQQREGVAGDVGDRSTPELLPLSPPTSGATSGWVPSSDLPSAGHQVYLHSLFPPLGTVQ
jgi:hypothetical protein